MTATDTNVLVRLLVEDDPDQAADARELLEAWIERGERCVVTLIVLAELEWVLTAAYDATRGDVIGAVRALAGNEAFELEAPGVVSRALDAYVDGNGDLSDYLIAARAADLGATTTYTFDRGLRRHGWFTLV